MERLFYILIFGGIIFGGLLLVVQGILQSNKEIILLGIGIIGMVMIIIVTCVITMKMTKRH